MRVLLVDDDVRMRQVLGRLLRASGYQVALEASDGEEAIELLATQGVDLILTDCQMPRMDGIALARAIRAKGDTTPIIMLSGHGDSHVIVAAIKAGVDNYLPKPVHPEILFEKIAQTLGMRQRLSA